MSRTKIYDFLSSYNKNLKIDIFTPLQQIPCYCKSRLGTLRLISWWRVISTHEICIICYLDEYYPPTNNYSTHFRNGQCQAPVMMDGVQTHVSMPTYVRVENFGNESHFRRPHRVTANIRENVYTSNLS